MSFAKRAGQARQPKEKSFARNLQLHNHNNFRFCQKS